MKRRFRKTFPEFKGFYPSKTYTSSKKGAFIYWGLYWHRSAAHIHEVKWKRYHDDGVEEKTMTPELYRGTKREKSEAFLKWERDHKYLEEAVTKLDEPVDFEALKTEKKVDQEETEITPDLCKVFRPHSKRARDLSIASPGDDDFPEQPASPT